MTKAKTKVRAKPEPKVLVDLVLNGETFSGAGKTFEDALRSIKLPRERWMKAIIRVTTGGQTWERMIRPIQVAKLFQSTSSVQEIVMKSFKIMFGL